MKNELKRIAKLNAFNQRLNLLQRSSDLIRKDGIKHRLKKFAMLKLNDRYYFSRSAKLLQASASSLVAHPLMLNRRRI